MESLQQIPLVDLRAQYRQLKPEIDTAIAKVLDECTFILGPAVDEFEKRFADYIGVRHAVGVSSGLDALQLALTALNVGPGDEVIVPANTFVATALAVTAVGARPLLVDCDARTYTIDPSLLEESITPRTRAIIPVHLAGQAADMQPILRLAQRYDLRVIEDAAQAHGTLYRDRRCGSLAAAGCFSFYPGKNLGAYGDGGAVTTDDSALAAKLRTLRNYGQRAKYEHVVKGINARLDSLQAAVLSVKLRRLDQWNAQRRERAALYRELLAGIGDVTIQPPAAYTDHIYHLFIIESAHRDALRLHLKESGVETGIHYPVPIHLLPAYADLQYTRGDFPITENLAAHSLSLPMFPEITEAQVRYVAAQIATFFADKPGRNAGVPN
jgi:dTDP-3-amino-3,4,6-trideoxy-alpha-D-glucose transaminase